MPEIRCSFVVCLIGAETPDHRVIDDVDLEATELPVPVFSLRHREQVGTIESLERAGDEILGEGFLDPYGQPDYCAVELDYTTHDLVEGADGDVIHLPGRMPAGPLTIRAVVLTDRTSAPWPTAKWMPL